MGTILRLTAAFLRASACCIGLLLVPLTSAASSAAESQVVGVVAALRGSATVRTSGDANAVALAVAAPVHEGDTVLTGADSRLKLALRDGSRLSLGAYTELKIDHLALGPAGGGEASKFTQLSGYVRAVVAPVRQPEQFEIQTPSMVAAVRGTDWIENYEAGATQIFVARGKVLATGVGTYTDQVLVKAGEGVTFSQTAPHTPVVRWKWPKIHKFIEATNMR